MHLLFAAAAVASFGQLLPAPASVCFVYHHGEIKRQRSDFPAQRQRPHPALGAVEQTPRCVCGQPRRERGGGPPRTVPSCSASQISDVGSLTEPHPETLEHDETQSPGKL